MTEGGRREVPCTDITSIVTGNASDVDNDSEDDETTACKDLDDRQGTFDLAISSDTEALDDDKEDEEDCHPNCHVDVCSPELYSDRSGDKLERKYDKPAESCSIISILLLCSG